MADSERLATLKLRFQVVKDRNVDAEFKKMRQSVESQTRVISTLNNELEVIARSRYVDNLAAQFKSLPPQLASTKDKLKLVTAELEAIGATNDEIKQVARSLADMDSTGGGGRGRTGGSSNNARGQAIGDAETTLRSFGVGGLGPDLLGAAEGISRLKESIGQLPPITVGAVAGIAAATLAIKLLADETQRVKEGARAQIDAITRYQEVVSSGTTESITAARDEAAARVKAAQFAATEANRINQEFERGIVAAFGEVGLAHAKLNATLGTGAGELRATQEAATDANAALAKALIEHALYTRALQDGTVAANDAAAAEAALAAERAKMADQLAGTQISTLLSGLSQSPDAVNDRINAIRNEIAITSKFIESGTLSAEKTAELQNQITLLGQEMTTLTLEVLPAVQALHEEAQAEAYLRQQRQDTIQAVQRYNAELSRLDEQNLTQRAALNERFGERVEQIIQNAVDAAENALQKLQARKDALALDLARAGEQADIEAARDAIDLQIEAQRDELKALRSYQDEVRRINRTGARSDLEAIQDRSAVALDASQRQRQDPLTDAQDQLNIDRRERGIANAQATADQRTQYDREREDRHRKFAQDLADAQAAYQADLQLAAQKRQQDLARAAAEHQADLAAQTQKFARERTLRQQAITAELALIGQGYQQRARVQAAYESQLVAQSQRILGQLSAYSGYGSTHTNQQQTGHVVGFAKGGVPPLNRAVMVGERGPELAMFKQPTRIYTASQTRQMGGGGMHVTFEGATRKTIQANSREEANKIFNIYLDEMGV